MLQRRGRRSWGVLSRLREDGDNVVLTANIIFWVLSLCCCWWIPSLTMTTTMVVMAFPTIQQSRPHQPARIFQYQHPPFLDGSVSAGTSSCSCAAGTVQVPAQLITPFVKRASLSSSSSSSKSSTTALAALSDPRTQDELGDVGKDNDNNNDSNANNDDEACEDEEECEIDWSQMPGWADDDDNEEENALEKETSSTTANLQLDKVQINDDENVVIEYEDWDGIGIGTTPHSTEELSSHGDDQDEKEEDDYMEELQGKSQQQKQQQKSEAEWKRYRLEMTWQLRQAAEECNVENPPSCGSEPCQSCRGRGWNPCRFCHGTAILSFFTLPAATSAKSFPTCPICRQGMETCKSCQGSGWIAGWTQLKQPTVPP